MAEVNITAQDMAQLIRNDPVVRLKAENIALRRRIAELEAHVARRLGSTGSPQVPSTGSPQVPLNEEACGGPVESIGVPEKDCA